MREIKFRAWDKVNNKMSEPFGLFDIYSGRDEANLPDGTMFYEEYLIIMQYTGLKDKNGKEIYEGDIVRVWRDSESILFDLPVEWQTNNLTYGQWGLGELNFPEDKEIEVIGNIYENKDLLK